MGDAERRRAVRGAYFTSPTLRVAICAMAPWFLGTGFSTFTFTILEERRAVFGHVERTGAEMVAEETLGWRLDLPQESAQTRLRPLPLPAKPPNLRIRPPRTVAEMRAMARAGQVVSRFLPERRRAIRRLRAWSGCRFERRGPVRGGSRAEPEPGTSVARRGKCKESLCDL